MTKKFKNEHRAWDYPIDCQICGFKCWHSESSKLHQYTGRGGLIVCPDCKDKIHYGFIPTTIRPDPPVPEVSDRYHSQDASTSVTSDAAVIDYSDPTAGFTGPLITWDHISDTWDTWDLPWGS